MAYVVVSPGSVVDQRYKLTELLGRGGMADVFRATDVTTDSPVALKLLRQGDGVATDRFRSEARALGRLDHPGVVGLRAVGSHQGVPYLVLDLVEGPSLADVLRRGPFGMPRARQLGCEVGEALAQAHAKGIVHRDVKPGNILLDRQGHAQLSDFGIARLVDSAGVTATGTVVGSAAYIAPEQLEGQVAGPPADVYALGLVLLECLSGKPVYSGSRLEAALSRLHLAPVIPSTVPMWLSGLLRAMTARTPERRPHSRAVVTSLRNTSLEAVMSSTTSLVTQELKNPPVTCPHCGAALRDELTA